MNLFFCIPPKILFLQPEEATSEYGFINEKTGESVFSQILPYLESMMDVTDLIIQRSKQLCGDANIPHSMRKNLKEHETSICNNISRVKNAAIFLVQINFKSFEPIIKLLIRLYSSLDLLSKHFIIRYKTSKEAVTISR